MTRQRIRLEQQTVPRFAALELGFNAPLAGGQKTGWFYDQTANRALLRGFLPKGAKVLDVCSYVGGWAVSALAGGAAQALCVDSSASALEAASANAALNGFALETRRGDAFGGGQVADDGDSARGSGTRFDPARHD